MTVKAFDPVRELVKLREKKQFLARKDYDKSKLAKFHGEVVNLRNAGGTYQEIADWLGTLPKGERVDVHPSTVMRYLRKNGI